MHNLKQRIQNGDTVHGCWLNLGSPLTAEIVGQSGFDWVLIDLEHGAGTEKDVVAQLQAIKSTGTAAIIRVESSEPSRISRVMDMGALGVMCPKVNNAKEAKKVITGLHYPPFGNRGVAKMVRATDFSKSFNQYYEEAKDQVLGVVQIETKEALSHLDEIAATEGVDVMFIGPSDLTMELGIFGQFDNPIFLNAVSDIVSAAHQAKKAVGILFFDPNEYKKYHDMGIRFIACGSDAVFVANGAGALAKRLNELRG
ncbi:MAG: aldolase/citrate lyase family protein [Saprospiraceae bacterium]